MHKHNDIHIHPGEILLNDVIKRAELTIGRAADMLKITKLTLSKIVNKRGGITPNIALRLEAVFGSTADFWLRLQRIYDLEEARRSFDEKLLHLKKFNYA